MVFFQVPVFQDITKCLQKLCSAYFWHGGVTQQVLLHTEETFTYIHALKYPAHSSEHFTAFLVRDTLFNSTEEWKKKKERKKKRKKTQN